MGLVECVFCQYPGATLPYLGFLICDPCLSIIESLQQTGYFAEVQRQENERHQRLAQQKRQLLSGENL
jgi:hypothetical protein